MPYAQHKEAIIEDGNTIKISSVNRNLEIGASQWPKGSPTDWELFDLHRWSDCEAYKQHIGDARDLSRFEDESFDQVYSSQTLEHFPRSETWDVLREWWRVVKTDGFMRLELPDMLGIYQDYIDGLNDWEHFVERIYGAQDYQGNFHFSGFTMKHFPAQLTRELPGKWQIVEFRSIADGGGFCISILKCS